MSKLTFAWMLGFACGLAPFFAICASLPQPTRRGRKPSPPYSSAAIALRDAEAKRDAKFIDPSLGVPWEEGHTQRGNGNGGPTTPKPPIKPYSSTAIAWQAEEAQRFYRGAMWREKGSDVWHPLGEPIDFTELARQQLNRTTSPHTP